MFTKVATAVASAALVIGAIAPAGAVPAMPQGYPISNLYTTCTQAKNPEWHYGETGRRYLNDGTLQFTNRTDQTVPYTATVETGTNHEISANSAAKLPNGWNTTAKSDIGLKMNNGWVEGETVGPIDLKPGESLRVEYGTVEKDFISMFVTCDNGVVRNAPGTNVIRGTGPAERYAFAYVVRADGSISDLALEIPSRSPGANSRPVGDTYTSVSGPSLEKVAHPKRDHVVEPAEPLQKGDDWPSTSEKCEGDKAWYPLDITAVAPTFRKPGYSQDFLNWSKGEYEYHPVTDHVVGAEHNPYTNWLGNHNHVPDGWLHSVGAVQRAYMPVGTKLKPVQLNPGERVRVEYGTTMTRINYREMHCGADGTYSLVSDYPQSSAPSGFWAEATVTSPDGQTRVEDITPDDYAALPVPTQTNY